MEILEEIAKKSSPSMRERLASFEEERKKLLESLPNFPEMCKDLGIECDDKAKDDVSEIKEAWDKKRACEHCQFTVDNVLECEFVDKYYTAYIRGGMCSLYRQHIEATEKRRKLQELFDSSGLGKRFKSRTFETFKVSAGTKAAYDACVKFCDTFTSESNGLLLIGSYGCGKTHLVASIIHRMAFKGVAGLFVVVPDLMAKIRASFGAEENKAEKIMNAAKKAEILVLDDLGAENATDWVTEQLYLIINYRYEHMLPTIITTNCKGQELEKKLGRRTLSRIAEMTTPIQIQAEDYRMRKFA